MGTSAHLLHTWAPPIAGRPPGGAAAPGRPSPPPPAAPAAGLPAPAPAPAGPAHLPLPARLPRLPPSSAPRSALPAQSQGGSGREGGWLCVGLSQEPAFGSMAVGVPRRAAGGARLSTSRSASSHPACAPVRPPMRVAPCARPPTHPRHAAHPRLERRSQQLALQDRAVRGLQAGQDDVWGQRPQLLHLEVVDAQAWGGRRRRGTTRVGASPGALAPPSVPGVPGGVERTVKSERRRQGAGWAAPCFWRASSSKDRDAAEPGGQRKRAPSACSSPYSSRGTASAGPSSAISWTAAALALCGAGRSAGWSALAHALDRPRSSARAAAPLTAGPAAP